MARAWIEQTDDIDSTILSIDVYENNVLKQSVNWLYRPLPWTIEINEVPDMRDTSHG